MKERERVLWQKLTRVGVEEAARAGGVVVQPLGSIEQHGPHLPLDTDIVDAYEVAVRAARQVEAFPVLVLPPIWWGLSPFHMPFAGTITLRHETFLALLSDVATSIKAHGFAKLVLLNGHGGNEMFAGAAAIRLSELGVRTVPITYWHMIAKEMAELAETDGGSIGHAGEMETSLQLYLQPDLVDRSYIRPGVGVPYQSVPKTGFGYRVPRVVEDSKGSGVFGLTERATAAKGERIVALAAQRLAEFLQRFHDSDDL